MSFFESIDEGDKEFEPGFMKLLKRWECTNDEFEAALLAYNTEPEPADFQYLRTSNIPVDEDRMGEYKMGRILKRMIEIKDIENSECPFIYNYLRLI